MDLLYCINDQPRMVVVEDPCCLLCPVSADFFTCDWLLATVLTPPITFSNAPWRLSGYSISNLFFGKHWDKNVLWDGFMCNFKSICKLLYFLYFWFYYLYEKLELVLMVFHRLKSEIVETLYNYLSLLILLEWLKNKIFK